MSTTTAPGFTSTDRIHRSTRTPRVWRVGAVAAVAAATATELVAWAARALDIPMRAGDPGTALAQRIPTLGFALPTLGCSAIGIVIAVILARRSRRPAHRFQATAVGLTVLSLVSPVFAGATTVATKTTLVAAHLVAAAIMIPVLTHQLRNVEDAMTSDRDAGAA